MMLAYQPVRTLATLNMGIHQGLSAAKRIIPIIEDENEDKNSHKDLEITKGNIDFENVSFKYSESLQIFYKKLI